MKKFTLAKEGSSFAMTVAFDLEQKLKPCSHLSYEAKISLPPSEISKAIKAFHQKKPPSGSAALKPRFRKGSLIKQIPMLDYIVVDYFEKLSESSNYWLQQISVVTPLQFTPGSPDPNRRIQIQLIQQDTKKQHGSNIETHTFEINLELCPNPLNQTKRFDWEIIAGIVESIDDQMLEIIRIRNALTAKKANVVLAKNLNYIPTEGTADAYLEFVALYTTPRSSALSASVGTPPSAVEVGIFGGLEASRNRSTDGAATLIRNGESPKKLAARPLQQELESLTLR